MKLNEKHTILIDDEDKEHDIAWLMRNKLGLLGELEKEEIQENKDKIQLRLDNVQILLDEVRLLGYEVKDNFDIVEVI